jgi:hypothetical protein
MANCHMLAEMKTSDNKLLAKEADKFIIRLPEGMREKIAKAAESNNRSMNAEIVDRLTRSFSEHSSAFTDVEKLSTKIADKVAKKLLGK